MATSYGRTEVCPSRFALLNIKASPSYSTPEQIVRYRYRAICSHSRYDTALSALTHAMIPRYLLSLTASDVQLKQNQCLDGTGFNADKYHSIKILNFQLF